jgi:thiamine-phosphate pyrophosphorylase
LERVAITPNHRALKPLAECRLYAFVDTSYLAGRDPIRVGRDLCAGGADIVQLRAKAAPVEEVQRIAEGLLPITRDAGVWLVVNDHVGVAIRVGAPACHLGQEDFFEAGHRSVSVLAPPDSFLRVGLSTHAPDQAARAVDAGAHYIAVGPVFATGTKPGVRPVTLDYVRWAADHIQVPWFAIGGIALDNVDSVLAAGARRICVVSAILTSADLVSACRAFRDRLDD